MEELKKRKRKRKPMSDLTKSKISEAQKNLSREKRANITNGCKNRYNSEYANKLSKTKLGELNPQHKLIGSEVIEIKNLWLTNLYSCAQIAEKYGVKRQTISDIVYGRTWKSVE